MWLLITKYALSALVIVAVSEIAKHTQKVGALIASLPLVTIVVLIWMHAEGVEREKISLYSKLTFWYVLPTLPMFLVMPWMLAKGYSFWLSLVAGCALTVMLFGLVVVIAKRMGVDLI